MATAAAPRLGLAGLAVAAALSACSKPDLVVVLPESGGRTGSVVVRDATGAATVLDHPFAAAEATQGGMRQTRADPTGVEETFGQALAARPIPPTSFRLYFLLDTDELTPESRAAFDSVFTEIARRPVAEVSVTGHTDTLASVEYNDRLSMQRATTVRDMLTARGLPMAAIVVAARGEREPLIPTPDGISEPRNRRVEITVR